VPARPFPCLTNLNQAGQLYGGIIYHKAPIMMRQLELILGEEGLREGLGEYLKRFIYESLLSDEQRLALTTPVENVLWNTTVSQPDYSRTKLVFRYLAVLASSPERVQQLYQIWSGDLVVDKLSLEEDERIDLAEILAIRLPAKSVDIIAGQLEDISNLDSRRRLEFIAPSLSADEAERDAFFDSLLHEENRRTERWVSDFLAQRPDYNPQLRMKILQATDGLFRAAAIRGAGLPLPRLQRGEFPCRTDIDQVLLRRYPP
jgi:hypothetical protein